MNRALALLLLHVFALSCVVSGKVVLIGSSITRSFDDIEANFARPIKASGEMGVLYVAEPLDACKDLSNKPDEHSSNGTSPFALIIRGGCSFEDKVRKAQRAGFKAAIVYDSQGSGVLVPMAGNSGGINIYAVFVTKTSGETLKKYAGLPDTKVWLIPSFENSAWSIMAISFISLLAISAVLATCFFVRRHRIRRRSPRVREFHGMSRRLVKAMPSLIFTSVHEDNTTATSCAICLEDYNIGDKLRVLPCRHKFHALCVDSWLTSWRTFCPVCKRDARTSTGEPPASESTPLLSSAGSSFHSSSFITSSGLHIGPPIGSLPSSVAFSPARVSSSYIQHSFRSSPHGRSPPINMSRSSADLRQQASPSPSQRWYMSPNSRYMSPYSNASLHVGSSSHRFRPLHCSESAATFSPFNSSHSLPDC
ncbi:PREDICTED: receptor homology region, transmembrane domain- and RING domain-containing protein 2-like [Tarenaya hassleriana]|uniref:receptor homology region, transmembrane domain- and RING domain-containing protein 2-like n=1 Tax=Tarenaya hassleriana TaxID=28532 RepID=UPI00053C47CC|nr:PREDICTED: receptor homology region, transmembrane domain- and RING domain-containing protein 2-like [Tarenaya hassleriana]